MSPLEHLELIVNKAQHAAAHWDGPALDNAVAELAAWDSQHRPHLSAAELQRAKTLLVPYLRVCHLLQESISEALGDSNRDAPVYNRRGRAATHARGRLVGGYS